MIDILLINPSSSFKKRYIHFLRDWSGGKMPPSVFYPPLDLAYAASLLRKNKFILKLVDADALRIPHKEIIYLVKKANPRFIEIPSSWGSFEDDLYLSEMIKNELPSTKIIMSGPHLTLEPPIALSSKYVDYVILGELEFPLLSILKGEESGDNIAYKKDSKIIINKRSLLQDLDSLPFPARDLLPNDKYRTPYGHRNPFTMMFTGRGCGYKCIFCQVNIWYMEKVRYRSIDNVLAEVDEIINKFGIREIILKDPTFTINRDRVINICNRISNEKYDISWRCFSRVDTIDKKLLEIMKEAGCYQICYGFESGSQKILDLNEKGITLEQAKNATRLTKEAGIEVAGAFMFGMYGETQETVKKTLEFCLKLDPDYVQFHLAGAVPSTKFYELCKDIKYPPLSKKELGQQLRTAYRKFYFRSSYIFKQFKKIKSLKQLMTQLKAAFTLWSKI